MSGNSKVSILMPAYNDSKHISRAVHSVLDQSHDNWELIIIDDGSTDNTPELVKDFSDERIIKLRQENSGQLNALLNGVRFAKGGYLSLLHSDDELLNSDALGRNLRFFEEHSGNGIFSDLVRIGENGDVCGAIRVARKIDKLSPARLLLTGGSNIIPDIFFVKKEAFKVVLTSYITWNMPYWLKLCDSRIEVLEMEKTEPWYKYRIHGEGHLQSDAGKFEVMNGCLRSVIEIAKRVNTPFLSLQIALVKSFGTSIKPLSMSGPSSPRNFRAIVKYVIDRYYEEVPRNLCLEGIDGFFGNFPSNRVVKLRIPENELILYGKDARVFYNLMVRERLPSTYIFLLEEAVTGFGKVVVANREDSLKAKIILKTLNLPAEVETE